jgi:pyruvate formate lyase activating enzyme
MLGRAMSVDEVLAEVLRDRQFHDQSGGGVTLSGGEPLGQADFVLRLLQALRARSVHTTLDTCGFAAERTVLELAPWVDLFLYDLKSLDEELHERWTGVSNRQILDNLQALNSIHANIWIRVPLIPGFNLEPTHLEAAARYVAGLPAVRQVHLLPYHRMGTGKPTGAAVLSQSVESVGPAIAEITPEQVELAAGIFRAVGLRTLIGG